jgi:hypothetical protein
LKEYQISLTCLRKDTHQYEQNCLKNETANFEKNSFSLMKNYYSFDKLE